MTCCKSRALLRWNNVRFYHSFDSYATFGQKKSTMISALKKVDYFASDNSERMVSAIHKLREFKNLDYPNDMRREVCEI